MADTTKKEQGTRLLIRCWGDCKNPANSWGKCRVSFNDKFKLPPAFEGETIEIADQEAVQSLLRNGYAEAVKE
jgi:hypothetical protein